MKKFSMKEALGFGWDTVKKNGGFCITILFIMALIKIGPELIAKPLKEDFVLLALVIRLIGAALYFIVSMGFIRIALKFCDGQQPNYADLFSCVPFFFTYSFASFLYGLVILLGLGLLIIPGIIWFIQFSFFGYLIIDEELSPVAALKKSSQITKGAKWDLFVFGLLIVGINILGFLCLFLGLLVSIPITMFGAAFVYRKLLSQVENVPLAEASTNSQISSEGRDQAKIPG